MCIFTTIKNFIPSHMRYLKRGRELLTHKPITWHYGNRFSFTSLTENSLRPEYFWSLKGKNAIAFMDCFQVVCVTKGTMEPIIVHFC